MGSAGSHGATVVLEGRDTSLTSTARKAAASTAKLEDQVARLEQALRKTNAKLDRYAERADRSAKSNKRLAASTKRSSSSMKDAGLQASGWISTMREAVDVADRLAKRQFNLNNVQANAPFSIDAAREATHGLISDYELMRQAVTANRLGVSRSEEEFARMAEIAVKLGTSLGRGPTESLEDLTTGLGRASPRVLDNIGIMVKANDAYKDYAKTLGKAAKDLTDVEKKQAIVTVGLKKGGEAAAKATIELDNMGAAWQRLTTSAENYLDVILNVQENTEDLANETFKTMGLTGQQAAKATDDLGRSAKDAFLNTFTAGMYTNIRETSDALDALGDESDELATTLQRGQPDLDLFGLWLKQTGTAAERTEKTIKLLGDAFVKVGEQSRREAQDALLASTAEDRQAQAHLIFKHRQEALKDLQKQRDKHNKKAAAAAKAAREAELSSAIAMAGRELDIVRRQVDAKKATTAELISFIDAKATAEQDLAMFRASTATNTAELLRAAGEMEAVEHAAAMERLDARKEAEEKLVEFADALAEKQAAKLEQKREIAAIEAELDAAAQLRAAEEIEDPLDRLEREIEIRQELIDVQLEAANDPIEALALADQREATIHELKMARLAEERAQRQKTHNQIVGITNRSAELHIGAAQQLATAVLIEGKSLKESVKNVAASEGAKQAIVGAAELIRAAVAVASFNYPKAALHVANAGVAFAFAGAMAATYGIAGGFSGKSGPGASPGAIGADAFGGGGAGTASGGASSSSSSGESNPIPESPSPQQAAGSSPSSSTGPTIIIQGDVVGTPKRQFYREVDKGMRDLDYSGRRAS